MAAGAPRHRAPKRAWGSTGNVLQALGVAAGGLLAVTVMTVLAGGPATPDTLVAASPAATTVVSPAAAVAGKAAKVAARPVVKAHPVRTSIWSVGGGTRLRPIGPTLPVPAQPVPPRIISTLAPAATPGPTTTPSPPPTRTAPPVVHPPRPTPTRPPTTPPPPTPTPEPTPTDPPPSLPVVPSPADLPTQPPLVPPDLPVG